ncbi:MAG TPA: phosphate ABC transporter substrate-binding protein PstS [Candidatus Solibacter sp.]|nr:phosphate ABC transporter substrate-binding protein PstS [Candidatus Solibacter sp.]
MYTWAVTKAFISKHLLVPLLVLSLATGLPAQETISLVGCGSVVPKALYGAWAEAYTKRNPQIQIKYLPFGSDEGIKQMTAGLADFGGGEIAMSDRQMEATEKRILHLPVFLTVVVPVYNVPGTNRELRFSGRVLAEIFAGGIQRWNHPELVKLNPAVQLPNLPITTVHREPGKGTTYLFTDFLSKTSPAFQARFGTSASPKWTSGLTAQGGEDMVQQVRKLPGAIGYAELNVAKAGSVAIGQIQNSSGAFVSATPASALAACPRNLKNDFRVSLTNRPGENAYPMTSFTWIFVPVKGASPARAKALTGFLKFIFTDGQAMIADHGHVALPPEIVSSVLNTLKLRE